MSTKNHYNYANRTTVRISFVVSVILIILGARLIYISDKAVGITAVVIGTLFFAYCLGQYIKTRRSVKKIINIVADEDESDYSSEMLAMFPLPMAIMRADGNILWYNNGFTDMINNDNIAGKTISNLIPDLKWGFVLQNKGPISINLEHNNRVYRVRGRIMNRGNEKVDYLIYLVFVDKTDEARYRKLYTEEKTDVAVINIDNYEYMLQKLDYSKSQNIIFNISKIFEEWIEESGGVLKQTNRDMYMALFEHKHLAAYTNDKFSVLEKVRNISDESQIPVSISMGIGTGGSISENEKNARTALDMAIGRGGDQAVIKDETQYKFYGAKSSEYEKSNRLKTRAVAKGLVGFIEEADKVLLVGHKTPDYDCFGAAMGMQRIVRELGKKPYILIDSTVAIENIYNKIKVMPEYNGMFLDENECLQMIDANTLIFVLDTSRNSLLPSKHILSRTDKIIVIDHHRRPTDYIKPCSLMYNEPYASSTCELVTEFIQYINDGKGILPIEAQSLYMGILMDTKNFLLKTGVRTFEAASYLKRLGLDTVAIKKMFNIDKDEYMMKAKIIEKMEHITDIVTMSECDGAYYNVRALASQAADEMLNVDNSQCSFVLYPYEGGIGISGRSLGDINVHLIMESLGGGGHQTVAGAQLHTHSMEEAKSKLKNAVLKYLEENNK